MIKVLFETKLTDVRTTDVEGVGNLRYEDNGRIFRWVKNRNATAFTAKQPVCYDVGNVGTVALIQSVNSPVSADLMVAAGIAIAAMGKSGGTTGCYGWVQVNGYCKDARVSTPCSAAGGINTDIAVGSTLVCVNALTTLSHESIASAAPVYSNHFIALETQAQATPLAAASKDVMVKCLM